MSSPQRTSDAALRAAYAEREAQAREEQPDAPAPTANQHRKLVRRLRKEARNTTHTITNNSASVMPARPACGPMVVLAANVKEKELLAEVLLVKATTKRAGRPHNLENDCAVIHAARQLNSIISDRPSLRARLIELTPHSEGADGPAKLSEVTARDRIRALTRPLNKADPGRLERARKKQ